MLVGFAFVFIFGANVSYCQALVLGYPKLKEL